MTIDLSGDMLLSLDLDATDDKAADEVHALLKTALGMVKDLDRQNRPDLLQQAPPDLRDPASAALDNLLAGITLAKENNHVRLQVKMPQGLPELMDKSTPLLKDLSPGPIPAPRPGAPRPGGQPKR
jgi:hypothetical protein